jgi:hypothetical protein
MGLFSDKCEALIDPQTGRKLSGDDLEKARQDPKWPRCRHRVKKAARFCSQCTAPAPGGWWKCPHCHAYVGNESNCCWKCSKPLAPQTRDLLAGGRWFKRPGILAERFDVGDVLPLLKKGLLIDASTQAILLDGGAVKDVLEPGQHNLDSLARRVNHWGSPPPRTVVLLDTGDIVIPVRVEALRSAEDYELELYAEVIIAFDPKGAGDFMANLMKTAERLRYEDLSTALTAEIRYVADNITNTSTVADLVKDPERRLRLEDELGRALQQAFDRYGLKLIRVASTDFLSPQYEEERGKNARLEATRRDTEFQQRLRDTVQKDKMDQFRSTHEFDEYAAQLAQERGVSNELRDQELTALKQQHRHAFEALELRHKQALELEQAGHVADLKDIGRGEQVKDAKTADEIERLNYQREMNEAREAIKLRDEKNRANREDLAGRAKIYSGMDVQTLITLVDDPARRQELMELQRQNALQGRKPEEILALAAERSPESARALQELYRLQTDQKDAAMAEQKEMHRDMADRLERIMKEALQTTATAAKRPEGQTNIIK